MKKGVNGKVLVAADLVLYITYSCTIVNLFTPYIMGQKCSLCNYYVSIYGHCMHFGIQISMSMKV